MFAPEVTVPALKAMKEKYPLVYGKYGFADAFNPAASWTNSDVLGIDVGITLLSAENLRSGAVWTWFMANSEAQEALRRVHLLGTSDHFNYFSKFLEKDRMPLRCYFKL